jgi:hypothetical protein
MRPIDFCTPKPFQLEHSCSAVSQRGDHRAMPCGIIRRPPSYRSLSTPCSFARTSLSRAASPVRRRALQVPGSSGPPDTERGRGESRFTARFSLRRPDDSHAVAFSSAVWSRYRPPLTPLSPPPRCLRGSRFFDPMPAPRRPPRPVPRAPRERRALRRPRVPSTDSRRAHPARAEARKKPRCLHRRRGAHVMRIAELHDDPPPFCLRWAPALARLSDLRWSGSRSRAPGNDQAFDPTETGGALL